MGSFHYVVIDAYMAMFHATRAILYDEGIQEKSHFAMYIYLKEKCAQKIPLPIIHLLNLYRTERHEAMYGLEYHPTKQEAAQALKDAETFVAEIEKVLLKS